MKIVFQNMPAVSFEGHDAQRLCDENPSVVKAVLNYSKQFRFGTMTVHVDDWDDHDDNLEWSLVISSAAGRSTVRVVQRVKGGSVLFDSRLLTT